MRPGLSIGPRASAVSVLSSEFVLLLKIPRNNLGGSPPPTDREFAHRLLFLIRCNSFSKNTLGRILIFPDHFVC